MTLTLFDRASLILRRPPRVNAIPQIPPTDTPHRLSRHSVISHSLIHTCVKTRSVAPAPPSPPPPRLLARASTSSKKIIVGAAARALLKSACIARSDSPSHLLSNSGPKACTGRETFTNHRGLDLPLPSETFIGCQTCAGCQIFTGTRVRYSQECEPRTGCTHGCWRDEGGWKGEDAQARSAYQRWNRDISL